MSAENDQVAQFARLLKVKNKWRDKAKKKAKAEQESRAAFEGGSGARRANILKHWHEPTAREAAAKDVVVYVIFVLFFTVDVNRNLVRFGHCTVPLEFVSHMYFVHLLLLLARQ
jgi:hypothetical protein